MTPEEILRSAAEVIEVFGWRQGAYGSPGSGFCILGALSVAYSGVTSEVWAPELSAAKRLIVERLGLAQYGISEWNDAPERTREEVMAVLRGEPCPRT